MKVVYQLTYISDSLNRENVTQHNMVLLLNNETSVFFNPAVVEYYQFLDNYAENMDIRNIDTRNMPRIPKMRYNVWRDAGGITATVPLGRYHYVYKETELQWHLLEGEKEILGKKCRLAKASTESDIFYAWYTSDISIPEGPFRFKNLPGLILETYNNNRTIEFSAISIQKSDDMIEKLNDPLTIKLKNKKDFFIAREQYIKHPFNRNISNKELERKTLESLKKWNVFLD